MSSSICSQFTQNAWKKDLCSNCFKSKNEHKQPCSIFLAESPLLSIRHNSSNAVFSSEIANKSDLLNKPVKSIIKKKVISLPNKGKSHKVCFTKNLSVVIGYGGDWTDDSDCTENTHDFINFANKRDETASIDDEETFELRRITRINTDFNMNNGNLLSDPQENIKKSFASLKLGAPQMDKEGKKQTLKINVVPFGVTEPTINADSSGNTKFESNTGTKVNSNLDCSPQNIKLQIISTKSTETPTALLTAGKSATINVAKSPTIITTDLSTQIKLDATTDNDGKNSPPIERAMEKSLLDEISETLENQQNELKTRIAERDTMGPSSSSKIKFEITSLADILERPHVDIKKPIARKVPISKNHVKPRIDVFHKLSDSESNSDIDISAYYDVVDTQLNYENLSDEKLSPKQQKIQDVKDQNHGNGVLLRSHYTTHDVSSDTHDNFHDSNFMTSKITSDGLIVTRCNLGGSLNSSGSSIDSNSDQETLYNMIRSEPDSGIDISIGNELKLFNLNVEKESDRQRMEKQNSNQENSDYEDIQLGVTPKRVKVATSGQPKQIFCLEKSRELHGEPDGSADPDGSLQNNEMFTQAEQLPALPKSPPPRKMAYGSPSFLCSLPKQHPTTLLKKPDLPTKPIISPIQSPLKILCAKRQPINIQDNCVPESTQETKVKKARAPNPPPGQNTTSVVTAAYEFSQVETHRADTAAPSESIAETKGKLIMSTKLREIIPNNTMVVLAKNSEAKGADIETVLTETKCTSSSNTYTRKFTIDSTSGTSANKNMLPSVIREKDKRERTAINPKFRSLNTFACHRINSAKNLQLQPLTQLEPTVKSNSITSNLSMSDECLASPVEKKATAAFVSPSHLKIARPFSAPIVNILPTETKTKSKFSIKKFFRMNTCKTADNLHRKEGTYSEICTADDSSVVGKPRLVIIHPIDINTTALEVVKDITKANNAATLQSSSVVTAKPLAPPLRTTDGQRAHEINKPVRPPPPKSVEMHRKQNIAFNTSGHMSGSASSETTSIGGGRISIKYKADNVYANLGEIRSSIAPRKPERTASMREREAQLELVRKNHVDYNENFDIGSICSSNGESLLEEQQGPLQQQCIGTNNHKKNNGATATVCPRQTSVEDTVVRLKTDDNQVMDSNLSGTLEHQKSKPEVAIKLGIFENSNTSPTSAPTATTRNNEVRPSSLKDSVRKINNTNDSYLQDKRDDNMYDYMKTPRSLPPSGVVEPSKVQRNLQIRRTANQTSSTSVSSCIRSEIEEMRRNGLNNSIASISHLTSASYCGSEIGEFDIYSPYSYYGSDAGGDVATDFNDSIWGIPPTSMNPTKATSRLRIRKGRSVVHKTIEDNYTAVVVANHEALAQVLEQLQQTPIVPPALRALVNAINLRFEDFTLLDSVQAFVVGKKAFHAGFWTNVPVTLALSADSNQLVGIGGELCQLSGGACGVLNPITEFCDLVPNYNLPLIPSTEVCFLQATISVLPRLQLDTLHSIGAILKGKSQLLNNNNINFHGSIPNFNGIKEVNSATNAVRNVASAQSISLLTELESMDKKEYADNIDQQGSGGLPAFDDVMSREVAFIMLQLINGMKNLQVKGIEEMPMSLSNVVLSKDAENKDLHVRLCVLQVNSNYNGELLGSLCQCANVALSEMLPLTKISPIISDILLQERSESLSKAKSVLEFVLWGPSDVALTGSSKDRELALQRWLDLERATVLHGLVRTRVELTVYDECHLMFLVFSSAKMMNDAARIICYYQ